MNVMTLTNIKEALMDMIDLNADAIGGLMISIDDNEMSIMNLGTTVGDNMAAIGEL